MPPWCCPLAKYLGIDINSKLSLNEQNTKLWNKANNTMAFIQSNLFGCPQDVQEK